MNNKIDVSRFFIIFLTVSVLTSCGANTAWNNLLKVFPGDRNGADPEHDEIVLGLREALAKGTGYAVDTLGRTDGFYRNAEVKIRMPGKLEKVEDVLRKLDQDEIVDDFILSMNRAAEQAVPEVRKIFSKAIQDMSFSDARSILEGPDDAATQYFRRTSSEKLSDRILPVVSRSTSRSGVTARYKRMVDKLGFASGLVDMKSLDLDRYVTRKTVDGLFTVLAEQERLIRSDPAARTTELLRKVFAQ